jgi:glutathione S-transferase
MFLAEKGLSIPTTELSLIKGEHKTPEHRARNSRGQVPVLALDDGTYISETVSICRYLEALHPDPPLFGVGAKGQALVDMAIRRIEFVVMQPAGHYWVHAHPLTARLVSQYKDYGESNRAHYEKALAWVDDELAGRDFISGDAFTMADICALTTIDFAAWIGLAVPPECGRVNAWHARVSARPGAQA